MNNQRLTARSGFGGEPTRHGDRGVRHAGDLELAVVGRIGETEGVEVHPVLESVVDERAAVGARERVCRSVRRESEAPGVSRSSRIAGEGRDQRLVDEPEGRVENRSRREVARDVAVGKQAPIAEGVEAGSRVADVALDEEMTDGIRKPLRVALGCCAGDVADGRENTPGEFIDQRVAEEVAHGMRGEPVGERERLELLRF